MSEQLKTEEKGSASQRGWLWITAIFPLLVSALSLYFSWVATDLARDATRASEEAVELSERDVARRERLTRQNFHAYVDERGTLVVASASEDVFNIERITVRPRFRIPGKFSDAETLGSAAEFSSLRAKKEDGRVEVSVRDIYDVVCSENQANLTRCAKYSVSHFLVEYQFDGDRSATIPANYVAGG